MQIQQHTCGLCKIHKVPRGDQHAQPDCESEVLAFSSENEHITFGLSILSIS